MPGSADPETTAARQAVPLSIVYLDGSQLGEALTDDGVLAAIRFGPQTRLDDSDPRLFTIGLPELGDGKTVEVWRSASPVQTGVAEGIRFACNGTVLFACLLVDEGAYPNLAKASRAAYRRLRKFVRAQGYPHLLRIWNYFPDINLECDGIERYQAFCLGRYQGLASGSRAFVSALPAACAIGTYSPGQLIYLLAARQPGLQVENPRQLSAFRYPRRYGPRSPSFSRAILKPWTETQSHLYISGTASIVGHETHHTEDLAAQIQETLDNLAALMDNANRRVALPFQPVLLKIYTRTIPDLGPLHERIAQRFGAGIPTLFLQGDICRADLLVEIEGLAVSQGLCDPSASSNPAMD